MTNEQILKKAIEKAIKGGFKEADQYLCFNHKKLIPELLKLNIYYSIIFSHSFAKAFWGEAQRIEHAMQLDWAYHLQIMVVQEHPLKYLEKFL